MRLPSVNPRRVLDWVAVLFPLAVSMAANYAWAARDNDLIAIVAGLVVPILLVLSVERWHAHRGLEGWQWWVRLAAMTLVTGVAAAVSWVHTSLLLYHHGWEPALAIAGPLGVDGLAVLGTLALWPVVRTAVQPVQGAVQAAVQTEPDQTEPEPVIQERGQTELGPGVQGSLQPVQVDRSAAESEPVLGDTVNRGAAGWTDEAILRDLRSRGETAIRQRAIRDRYKVGPAKADRVLEKLRTSRLEAVS